MLLDHLTTQKSQIGVVSGLDHLTTSFNAFLLSCRVDGLSPATLQNYKYQLGKFVRFCNSLVRTSGAIAPPDAQEKVGVATPIEAHQIRLFLLNLRETNCPTSVGDYYKSMRRFFNWLVDEGLIEKSPMQNIKPPRREDKLIRPFSQQDLDNLLMLTSSNRFLDLRNRAIILVFLDTGLRLSELAKVEISDINFERELIKVMGKGARERVVGIGKTTQKALLRYLLMRRDNHSCLWVTEEGKPLTVAGMQIAIKKLCYRAEIKDAKCGPHTFRHTFGTRAMLNGASEREVQLLLGHSTDRMTKHYTATITSENVVGRHGQFSPVDKMRIK